MSEDIKEASGFMLVSAIKLDAAADNILQSFASTNTIMAGLNGIISTIGRSFTGINNLLTTFGSNLGFVIDSTGQMGNAMLTSSQQIRKNFIKDFTGIIKGVEDAQGIFLKSTLSNVGGGTKSAGLTSVFEQFISGFRTGGTPATTGGLFGPQAATKGKFSIGSITKGLLPKNLLGAGAGAIGGGLAAMGPQMLALSLIMKPIGALLEGLMAPLEPLVDLFGMVGEVIGLLLVPIVNALMEVLLPFMPLLVEIVMALMPLIRFSMVPLMLLGKMLQFLIPILTGIVSVIAVITDWINSLMDFLENWIDNAISKFKMMIDGLFRWLVDMFEDLWDKMKFWE